MDLRANTAVDVLIGPFVDKDDGNTTEDGLTLTQAEIKLSKNGQALAQKNDVTSAAFDDDGYYNCELDATDTNTEGNLVLIVHQAANALPIRHEYAVLSEAAYDSMYLAKDVGFMDVNIKTVGRADAQETEANNLETACANYSATRGLTGTAVPAAVADGAFGLPISDAGGLDLDAKLAATNEITAVRMAALTDWINGGRLDLLLDAIPTTVMRGTDSAALASVCTEVRLATLTDWINNGRLDLILDAIPTTAMRGTDSAALASVCTETRLAALTDWLNGGRLDLLLDAIPTTVMRGTDSALTDKDGFTLSTAGILAVWHQLNSAIVTAGSMGKLLKDEITAVRMAVLTDWINGGRLDLLLDAIPTTVMRGTDSAALASEVTAARMSELDAGTGGKMANQVDVIQTSTTAGGSGPWTTGSGTGLTPLASGTAQGGTASTIQLAASETFADDELNGNVVKITAGTGKGQSRVIKDYVGGTDTATVDPDWTTTPSSSSVYEVVDGSVNLDPVQSEVNDALIALGLDHLLGASVVGADITNDSIIARLVSKAATADWDTFNHTTESLEALRDFFQSEGLSASAGTYDRTTTTGRMLQTIRQILDEPESNVKYTDEVMLGYARSAWAAVIQDLMNVADNPIVLRLDISVGSSTQDYVLPPIVGEILQLAKINAATDLNEWEMVPGSRWNPAGPGFTIEGNIIRFTPKWQETHVLRLTFIPTGDMVMHSGDTTVFTSTTITMDNSPTTGALDLRENAYAGSILRILNATWPSGSNRIQERVVSAYDATTRIATVTPAFNPVPDSGTVTYEIVPMLYNLLEMTVCYFTASMMLTMEAPPRKQAAVDKKYNELLRALKLRLSNIENRVGDRFEHDTPENQNFSPWGVGFWS